MGIEAAAVTAVVKALMVLVVATNIAITIAKAITGTSSKQQALQESRRGVEANTMDTQEVLPVVYGRRRIGINRVFMSTVGTSNEKLYIVGTLCEGPIKGIAQVDGVDQIWLNDELYTAFGANVSYWFHDGASDQAVDATLASVFGSGDIIWDAALRNTAYIVICLEYDPDLFQSIPNIVVEVEGLEIYNPSTTVTEYSNNPALCVRDYLIRSARRGGMGISATRLNDTSIIDSAAYCTAKGWTCDIVFNGKDRPVIDNLRDILNTFRGTVIRSGAEFRLQYRDLNYETSVMDITEDDVIETSGKSSLRITQPSIFDTPNAVNMQYVNSEKEYADDEYVLADSAAVAADGDYREKEIALPGITSTANVMKMANYFLEKLRVNKTASLMMGSRGMVLEPEDVITLTHSRPGWDEKLLRVAQPAISQNGEVGLALEEEDEDFYDDTYNLDEHDWYDTTLPSPSAAVASVINVTNAEEVYDYRGRSFTRWKIDFDRPLAANYPWWDHAEIYIKIGTTGDWKFQTKAVSDFILDPVEEGKEYYCCIVSVSIWGTKQAFADGFVISRTIEGKTEVPANITGMTALTHGDNVTIFADELADPDIAGYEVRLGDAWAGGIFIGFNESPNIRLVGVRPGTHKFWMAAKDNAGHYSAVPVSATCIVYYPSGYVDKNTWAWDFDGIGVHDNTEHATYSGSDALKCSHTGGVLTGTWTSPEYDLGSEKTVRIWADFLTVFSSSAGTWAAMLASGATWAAVLESGKRWYELLAPAYAGVIQAKLKWGSVSGSLTNETTRLEILAPEITARYVQFEITITDPDAGSNLYLKTLNCKAAYWS